MGKRRNARALPPTKLAAPQGHRSHVSGSRRLLANPKRRGEIADALHADAAAIMRRLEAAQRQDPPETVQGTGSVPRGT